LNELGGMLEWICSHLQYSGYVLKWPGGQPSAGSKGILWCRSSGLWPSSFVLGRFIVLAGLYQGSCLVLFPDTAGYLDFIHHTAWCYIQHLTHDDPGITCCTTLQCITLPEGMLPKQLVKATPVRPFCSRNVKSYVTYIKWLCLGISPLKLVYVTLPLHADIS
jgi:hypothetical protein